MSIDSVTSTSSSSLAAEAGVAALSPETLLAYCSSRLSTIDSTIEQYFAQQQANNKRMQDINNVLRTLSTLPGIKVDVLKAEEPHRTDHANLANDLAEVYRTTGDPDLRKEIEGKFTTLTGQKLSDFRNADGTFRKLTAADINTTNMQDFEGAAWTAQVDTVKNLQSSISKGSELNMIQLQALVSQRQLAIQLTTQMMQTMHESSKQVLGNVR